MVHPNTISNAFGKALRKKRMTLGHTLKEAADIIGVCNNSTLSLIERGLYKVSNTWMPALRAYKEQVVNPVKKEEVIPSAIEARKGIMRTNKTESKKSTKKDKVDFPLPRAIQRIRVEDENGHIKTIGYLVADVVYDTNHECFSDYVGIGISRCHEGDKFSRIEGLKLAISRIGSTEPYTMKKHTEECAIVMKHLSKFINRCWRYFKDKNVIIPRIHLI